MSNTILDVIVVGAGQAGLSASYNLTKLGLNHLVFERGKIAESWRSQRWDSFVVNSPKNLNVLPGDYHIATSQERFTPKDEFVSALNVYASKYRLPVKEQTSVVSIEKLTGDRYFSCTVSKNGSIENYKSRQVILCSGAQSEKKIPMFAAKLPQHIMQMHSSEYRNAGQFPDGCILVVGGGQSGCQIADDLALDGRKVYLSTSMVPRVPRRYRGKDIMDWLHITKFFEVRTSEVTDPEMFNMRPPQLTGTGGGKNTISLQGLAQKGVIILGRTKDIIDQHVYFQQDAAKHVQFADGFSKKVKGIIDDFIEKNLLNVPAPEEDIADMQDTNLTCISPVTSLNLEEENVSAVIWTTGYNAGFNYVKLPVFNDEGNPEHQDGLTETDGLYFLGLPWQRKRKSSLIFGVDDDAAFICEKVHQFSVRQTANNTSQKI